MRKPVWASDQVCKAVQPQKMAKRLEISDLESRGLYYVTKKKGAAPLFWHMQKAFLVMRLINLRPYLVDS